MARTLLVRGMLVGLVAGVLAFGFASLFGESPIDQAIAFEGAHVHGADGPELVSRAVQSTFGLMVLISVLAAVGAVSGRPGLGCESGPVERGAAGCGHVRGGGGRGRAGAAPH